MDKVITVIRVLSVVAAPIIVWQFVAHEEFSDLWNFLLYSFILICVLQAVAYGILHIMGFDEWG